LGDQPNRPLYPADLAGGCQQRAQFEHASPRRWYPLAPVLSLYKEHISLKQLLNPQQLADLLGVSISFVYDRTQRNAVDPIPHFKLGKYLRFDSEQVQQWLSDRIR